MKSSLALLAALFVLLVPASAHASPRVIGGKPATAGAWGFIVPLLAADNPDAYAAQFCGGSYVAARFVITAAHCVADGVENENGEIYCDKYRVVDPAGIQIAPGLQYLPSGGSEERIQVKSITVHPDYASCSIENDVAVLELTRPAVTPHTLVPLAHERPTTTVPGSVAGWGTTEPVKGAFPRQLMSLDLSVFSSAECNANLGDLLPNGVLPPSMVCAGVLGGSQDTCSGDSGGPLIAGGLLVGLTSWGFGCASEQYGVYTNVPVFREWVLAQLQESAPLASNIKVAQTKNPTQAVIRWAGAAPTGASWVVSAVARDGRGPTKTVSGTRHGLRVKNLTPGTDYIVTVVATGTSNAPAVTKFRTKRDVVKPTPVVSFRATKVTRSSITLRWRGGFDFNGPIFGLVEWYSVNGVEVGESNIEVTGRAVELAGLKPNTTYRYQIDVYDAAGNDGRSSNILSVTTRK